MQYCLSFCAVMHNVFATLYRCMWYCEDRYGDIATFQYFGKWPFIRVFGMQEVASVLFSILNLCAHVYGFFCVYLPARDKAEVFIITYVGRDKGGDKKKLVSPPSTESPVLHETNNVSCAVNDKNSSNNEVTAENIILSGDVPMTFSDTGDWFMHGAVRILFNVSCFAWIAAAVFHTRDVQVTQFVDYLFAGALIFASFYATVVRVFSVYQSGYRTLLLSVLLLLFISMQFSLFRGVSFDFSLNMKIAVGLGLTYSLLHIGWSLYLYRSEQRNHVVYGMWATVLTLVSTFIFEVYDFPPMYGYLDAHACWHASTVPIVILWYAFYRKDVQYDMDMIKSHLVKKHS